jgi:hypothetical protein
MKLCRLIYKSVATAEVVSNKTLRSLQDQAAAANAEAGITGLLVLAGNTFVQVLEGDAQRLTTLMGNIARDKRHRMVELISFMPVAQRNFDAWNMRLIDLYDLPGDKRAYMVSKYGQSGEQLIIPDDEQLLHALLIDARHLCLSLPWQSGPGSDGSADADERTSA